MSVLAAALLAGAAFLPLAAIAQEKTITHAQGETVLPGVPETVLSFDIAALDTLDALGVTVAGVPQANLPASLSAYSGEDVMHIGSLSEPDYEAVNAAEADLIIVAGRSSSAYPELSAIAPTVDLSNDWTDFVGSVKANTETLGEIFDKQAEVETMIAELDESIAEVQAAAPDYGTVLVVMTSGGEVTAYGPGSRFGFVHDDLGLVPAVEDVEEATHGEAISFEFILETNPDWLIVIDRDSGIGQASGEAAAQVLDNELVAQTTAWQNDQVIYVDAIRWYIVNGGLRNLQAMVDELATGFEGTR